MVKHAQWMRDAKVGHNWGPSTEKNMTFQRLLDELQRLEAMWVEWNQMTWLHSTTLLKVIYGISLYPTPSLLQLGILLEAMRPDNE